MKPYFRFIIGSLIALAATSSARVVWEADFEDQTLGITSGSNSDLGTSEVQTANELSGVVVNAPAGLSRLSGKVLLLSCGVNSYAAIRPISALNPIELSGLSVSNRYSLSFDLYIPGDTNLMDDIGSVQFRWKNASNTGNGPELTAFQTKAPGEYHVTYSERFADDVGFIPTSVYPFVKLDQNGTATADFVYFDNLSLEIETDSFPPVDAAFFASLRANRVTSNPTVRWQNFGPGMSGYIDAFWIHDTDPDAMFMSLDMGDNHGTWNRGESWNSLRDCDGTGGDLGGIQSMAFSHQDPDFGLALTKEGLYVTEDKGHLWEFLVDTDRSTSEKNCIITVDPNNDQVWFIGAGQHWSIKATHFNKNGLIYTGDYNHSEGYLLKSTNKGQTWTKIPFPEGDEDFSKIIVDPRHSNRVFASCQYGLYRSEDGGANWAKVPGVGLPHNQPRDLGYYYDASTGEFLLYMLEVTHYTPDGNSISTSGGVYRSADNGDTWDNLTGNLAIDLNRINSTDYMGRYWRAIAFWLDSTVAQAQADYPVLPSSTFSQFIRMAVDPKNKDRIYLVHNYKHDYSFPPGNIWMTENGGTNWIAAAREGPYWENEINRSYWQGRGNPLGVNVKYAHVAKAHIDKDDTSTGPRFVFCNQRSEVYSCFAQQMMRSLDHGATWNQIDDVETAPGSGHWVGRGDSNLPGESLCVDTGTPGSYLFGSGEHGLWRNTLDGDLVYPGAVPVEQLSGQSFSEYDQTSISTIAVHPNDPNKIYTLHFRQRRRGELRYSSVGGGSWVTLSTPVDFSNVADNLGIRQHSLMLDPDQPDNMYFCVPVSVFTPYTSTHWRDNGDEEFSEYGIYRSFDGGRNWSLGQNGIPVGKSICRLAMDHTDSQTVYAAANETHTKASGGLYRTTDGGDNWSAVNLPAGVKSVNAVELSKVTGDLYIACGTYSDDGSTGGAWVSRDGGSNWTLLFDLPNVKTISPSAASSRVMAVIVDQARSINSRNPGIYVTVDGSESWHKINTNLGQPDRIHELATDPHDENVLWCCVFGTGFWKANVSALSGAGDPEPLFWEWMTEQGLKDRVVDADADGFDARLEYIAGTDPNDAGSFFQIKAAPNPAGGNHLIFNSTPNRLYSIDMTDDLQTSWMQFTNGVAGTGNPLNIIGPEITSNRFYRVKVNMR